MKAGVLKETWPGETRVAVVPGVVPALVKAGLEVVVETGAGAGGRLPRRRVRREGGGARRARRVLADADVLLRGPLVLGRVTTRTPSAASRPDHVVIGFLDPLQRPEGASTLAGRGATSFALELLPRISRAQSMDVLSSTATMVGYKAVLLAADALPRMMPMMMTAAGTVAPATRLRDRGRGRRPAGHRHRPAPRRGGRGLRRPARGEGAGPQPGGEVRRAAPRGGGGRGRGRLREGSGRGLLPAPARAAGQGRGGERRRDQRGRRPRPEGPRPRHRRRWSRACARGRSSWTSPPSRAATARRASPGGTSSAHGVTVLAPLSLATTIPYHASQLYAKNVANFVVNMTKKGELAARRRRRDRAREHADPGRRGRPSRGSGRRWASLRCRLQPA